MGGQSNQIDPNSAVVPVREGTVLWFHAGALWTEQSLESQSLAFVDALWAVMNRSCNRGWPSTASPTCSSERS